MVQLFIKIYLIKNLRPVCLSVCPSVRPVCPTKRDVTSCSLSENVVTHLPSVEICHHGKDDEDDKQDGATDTDESELEDVGRADRLHQLRLQLIGQ